MQEKVIAIDQGTSSSRAMCFDMHGNVHGIAQKELRLFYPHSGWVEQNPEDIWNDARACLRDISAQHPDARAIGITNQRETTILWDKRTGKPFYNAIVWQDRRTAEMCQSLRLAGHENSVRAKTGLLLDPYFSATKIRWILDNVPAARQAADEGYLAFGTVDSFLIWRLTGGALHVTDVTNASRTMLMNIHTMEWDDELLTLFGVPHSCLPMIKENVADFGITAADVLDRPLPISGVAGDQQAAFIGQGCFTEGLMKSTYGTGCFALMNIGPKPRVSNHKLLTSVGYKIHGKCCYVLEGSIFVAGAAVQWLRDQMGFVHKSDETKEIAISVPDNGGVYFVPAFTGLGAPYWNPDVRGAIFGLTRDTTKAHIVRAALEAQAYQTRDLLGAFEQDAGGKVKELRVDGGLVANDFAMQFLADIMGVGVDVPVCTETTALGAAYLAMIGQGMMVSLDEISAQRKSVKQYHQQMDQDDVEKLYSQWQGYIEKLI